MSFVKSEGTYPSPDKTGNIAYYIYTPQSVPKAIIHLVHDMCGHIGRYETEGLIEELTNRSIIVCGCDLEGHGKSAADENGLGYFPDYNNFTGELRELNLIMRKKYRQIPYIMLGTGMGAAVICRYITAFGYTVDGAVLCGIVGDSSLRPGLMLSSLIGKIKGDRYRSSLIERFVHYGYNKNFKDNGRFSWLSGDAGVRQRFEEDKLCSYVYTCAGYKQYFLLLSDISSEAWAEDIPKSLPVYIISGERDPAGREGQAPRLVYEKLENAEVSEIKIRLYENGRHDILNDECRNTVLYDLDKWTDDICEGVAECRNLNNLNF